MAQYTATPAFDWQATPTSDRSQTKLRLEVLNTMLEREKRVSTMHFLVFFTVVSCAFWAAQPTVLIGAMAFRIISLTLTRHASATLHDSLKRTGLDERALRFLYFALAMAGVSWAGLVIALDPSPLAQGGDHPLVWIAVGSITLIATGLVTITFGPIKPAAFSLTGAFLASLLIATVLDPTPIPLIAIAAIAPALLGALGYGFMAAAQTEHEARLVIENKALNARLVSSLERADNLVRRDPMTGLFNRRVLFSDFKNAPSLGEVRTFIQIDLDQFRLVNSRFGQDVGDSILRGLAREMEGVCKSLGHGKFACVRLGGEEFAIMLDQMDMRTGEALAYGLRERIPAIPSPAELRMGLKVSASFSIAEQRPKEALADLLRRSDEAMQRAKACGGGSLAPAE